jgi:hypothetical protein
MLDLPTQKLLYNRCDPFEPLIPEDNRNLDLDMEGDARHRVRGEQWVDVIETHLRLSDQPVRVLFSGLPGSGKSTELLRLAGRLKAPDRCNQLPVIANAGDLIDLGAEIDVPDVLIMALHAAERAVLAAEGRAPELAFQDGALVRLWGWFTRTDVTLTKPEFSVADAASLTFELKSRDPLRKRVRDTVARNLLAFRREVREAFEDLRRRALALGRAGITLIVDSLDKLQGSGQGFWDVLESARRVFTNGAPHLDLPVHAIYTVPSALLRVERFDNVHFLPMVKVTERDGSLSPAGVAAARRMIEKRVPTPALRELLGSTSLDQRLEQVIRWSGGYPREIVTLLRAFVVRGGGAVTEEDFQRVLRREGDAIRRMVPDYAFEWLAHVHVEKRLLVENPDHRRLSQEMLQSNVVMRYLNDEEWFDIHPAVHEIPGVVDAVRHHRERKAPAAHASPSAQGPSDG